MQQSEEGKPHLTKIIPYLGRFKWRIVFSLILLVASKALAVADPYIIKILIDILVVQGDNASFSLIGGLVVLFFAVRWGASLLDGVKDYIFTRVEAGIKRLVALDVFKHLLDLSVDFHTNRATGGIARKVTRGIHSIETLLFFFTGNVFPTLIEIIFVVIIFLILFPLTFTLAIIGFVVLYITFTILVAEKRQGILLERNKQDDKASGQSVDALLNYETVKSFANEAYEYKRYNTLLKRLALLDMQSTKWNANLNMGQALIITATLTTLLFLALNEFLSGAGTVGDFVLVTTYLARISIPLNFLGFVYRRIKEGLADIDEMLKLLDVKRTVSDKPYARTLKVHHGHIEFKNVSFGYIKKRAVLKNVSINIPAKKSAALVGYSGSGKSTIPKLLLRFYDIEGGSILIDGVDIRDVTQHSLRKSIGIVAQDTILFNDAIFNNIAYGKPGASREQVERAARLAHIHDFITNELPDGYETIVGERGVKLSGGEKQRVAIARMLLKDPPILVFDEATASLDSEAEKSIQQAIRQVSQEGRTTLVIAHRLSTIRDFDKIVVMEKGQVVEEGKHDELLMRGGLYHKLWTIQNARKE